MKSLIKKFIPESLLLLYHKTLAIVATILFWFPSRKLTVIGVTGTNGKTSTSNIVWELLTQAGHTVGLTTSINFKIGKRAWVNRTKQGMQGRFRLQRLLRKMVRSGCTYAVIETTSEGIKQYRHWGIDYDVAVFTNLTPEHIEAHGSFKNYKHAKGELFRALRGNGVSVVNQDDEHASYFAHFPAKEKWGYALDRNGKDTLAMSKTKNSDDHERNDRKRKEGKENEEDRKNKKNTLVVTEYTLCHSGTEFSIFFDGKEHHFKTRLLGTFNIYNSVAAIAVGLSQNLSIGKMQKTLSTLSPIAGRMEVIHDKSRNITVIVDYAHDPVALEQVYQTIHEAGLEKGKARLIAVLGAVGGGRDKAKRPKLGALAAKYADEVVLTNEDPYKDDPMEIIEQIEKGVLRDKKRELNRNYWKVLDRRKAIQYAVSRATPGDVIALTGKGGEVLMAIESGYIPWDDSKVVQEVLGKA